MKINSNYIQNQTETIVPKQPDGVPQAQAEAKPKAEEATALKSVISEALSLAGFKSDPDFIKLAQLLIKAQMPINKETLTSLNQSLKLMGQDATEKALFLLANDIRPTPKTTHLLSGFVNGENKIASQLQSLAESIATLSDGELKDQLVKLVLGEEVFQNLEASLTKGESSIFEKSVQPSNVSETAQAEVLPAKPTVASTENALTEKASDSLTKAILELPKGEVLSQEKVAQLVKEALGETIKGQAEQPTVTQQEAGKLQPQPQAQALEKIIPKLTEQLNNVIKEFAQTSDTAALKSAVKTIVENEQVFFKNELTLTEEKLVNEKILLDAPEKKLSPKSQTEVLASSLKEKLAFNPKGTTNKELDNFYKELVKTIDEIKNKAAEKLDMPEAAKILKEATAVNQTVDFFTHVKNNLFMQIPLSLNDGTTNAELYVFKDKKKKSEASGESLSALIALDTASMGHFEAYVQKNRKSINVQFRIEGERIEKLVRENVHLLNTALLEHGYSLDGFGFKKEEEAFTLLDLNKLDLGGSSVDGFDLNIIDMKG